MQDLIYAALGVVAILIGVKAFDNFNVNRNQKNLEKKVSDNDKKQAGLEGEQRQEDKETQRRVDEIEKEKNDKPSGGSLADWFNNRK